jgi:predicted metal-binding membrane protein
MTSTTPPLLRRQRYLILGVLLALAALAWGVLIWQAPMMSSQAMGLTMGLSAGLFIAIWAVMMVAMMFPAAAPMIVMFGTVYASKRAQQQPYVPTWIFVSGYLLVWILPGVVIYVLAVQVENLTGKSMWLMQNGTRISGSLLVLAGLYQLSPLKNACLSKCRTPLQFLLTSWHDGHGGAFRMGVEHGAFCLGCCWLLFVILIPLGLMNLPVMALVTALIFAEKALPVGRQISLIAGVGLIAYGALVVVVPAALPMGF